MFKPSRIKYDILLNTQNQGTSQTGPTGSTGPTGPIGPVGSGIALPFVVSAPSVLETTRYVALTIDGTTYNVVSIARPR